MGWIKKLDHFLNDYICLTIGVTVKKKLIKHHKILSDIMVYNDADNGMTTMVI